MLKETTFLTQAESQFLHGEFKHLVAKLTSEMQTRDDKKQKWRYLKKQWNDELNQMMGIDPAWGVKAGQLFSFDLDARRKLILLNYTPAAHNVLHEVGNGAGWTAALRLMRGLVYAYERPGDVNGVRMVSRSFRKFFNLDEVPDSEWQTLLNEARDKPVVIRAKEDGAMIQYFEHKGQLCATTRGRLETQYVSTALGLFTSSDFAIAKHAANQYGIELMTVVVELVHPISAVHVDYNGEKSVYLLAAYDKGGEEIPAVVLERMFMKICDGGRNHHLRMPLQRVMTLQQARDEINDRSVMNKEGWVAFVGSGPRRRRIKLKYISYIGEMVKSKLSYKYVMNCLCKDRVDYMFHTLPEEIREVAYRMVAQVQKIANDSPSYKALYVLHSENEGGVDYFRTVCRQYYRWEQSNKLPKLNDGDVSLPIYAA